MLLSAFAGYLASVIDATNFAELKKEIDMDTLFSIGQLLALAGLACGAYLCFSSVRKFDVVSLPADISAPMHKLGVGQR